MSTNRKTMGIVGVAIIALVLGTSSVWAHGHGGGGHGGGGHHGGGGFHGGGYHGGGGHFVGHHGGFYGGNRGFYGGNRGYYGGYGGYGGYRNYYGLWLRQRLPQLWILPDTPVIMDTATTADMDSGTG